MPVFFQKIHSFIKLNATKGNVIFKIGVQASSTVQIVTRFEISSKGIGSTRVKTIALDFVKSVTFPLNNFFKNVSQRKAVEAAPRQQMLK